MRLTERGKIIDGFFDVDFVGLDDFGFRGVDLGRDLRNLDEVQRGEPGELARREAQRAGGLGDGGEFGGGGFETDGGHVVGLPFGPRRCWAWPGLR